MCRGEPVDSTVLAERLCAQLLGGPPAGTVVDVARRLLAIQAQDPRGARLAIRARSAGLSAQDVDRALSVDRSVVITTVNRGTLHLVRTDDYWWLSGLTTPQLSTANRTRLEREQVGEADADRGVAAIERALTNHGPLTRAQLRDHVATAGVRVEGQALAQLLLLATLHDLIVRGPVIDGDHAFVLVRDWLGPPPPPMPRPVALGELARRYLAGHGPASERDLRKWAGITLRDAHLGFTAIASQLVERGDGLAALIDRSGHAELPPPRLLGAFDPSLLGWESREQIVGAHQDIVTTNGLFRPFAMVEGRAVGTWTMRGAALTLAPFAALPAEVTAALEADAASVVEFFA